MVTAFLREKYGLLGLVIVLSCLIGCSEQEPHPASESPRKPRSATEVPASRRTITHPSIGERAIVYGSLDMYLDEDSYEKSHVDGVSALDNITQLPVQHRLLTCNGGEGTNSDFLRLSLY
jgi:hypothetical protein